VFFLRVLRALCQTRFAPISIFGAYNKNSGELAEASSPLFEEKNYFFFAAFFFATFFFAAFFLAAIVLSPVTE
jgi:hypothetical protein